jgi:hypothetical protein
MRKRGFNLLELCLAMVLFSTVVVFIAGMWSQQARISLRSQGRITATYIAEMKTEELIGKGYSVVEDEVNSQPESEVEVSTFSKGHETIVKYKVHLSCPACPDPAKRSLVGVLAVKVDFPDQNDTAADKFVLYETYLAKPTPASRGLSPTESSR